jgi:hypothetical protein
MRIRHYTAAAFLCCLLSACASMGLVSAQSVPQQLSYAYGVNAGLRNAAANSLNAGTIKVDDAEYVLKTTDQTRTLLDTAGAALSAGDTKTAEGRVVLAIGVLEQLQSYLTSKVQK